VERRERVAAKNVAFDGLGKKLIGWQKKRAKLKQGPAHMCVGELPIRRQVKRKRKLLQSLLKSILKVNLLGESPKQENGNGNRVG